MFALTLLIAMLLGTGIAVLVAGNAMRIGTALGLLDLPDGLRKLHAKATPLVGGIAVAAAAIAGGALAFWQVPDARIAAIMVAVAAMFIIGIVDDRRHLPPAFRLVAALAVLSLVIAVSPDLRLDALQFSGFATVLMLGPIAGAAFTLVCLVGLLNAVNMADGKNGVVAGMASVWSLVLAAHAPPMLWPVLAATAAALAVVWRFNMAGRLFLGDGGSYALSALFGLVAIFVYNITGADMLADDVALLFAVPVFDTIRLMAVRTAGGRSPFAGDRDHLHHHIHARLGWPQGLIVYLALVAVPNFGALLFPGTSLMWLLVTAVAYAAVVVTMRVPQADGSPAE